MMNAWRACQMTSDPVDAYLAEVDDVADGFVESLYVTGSIALDDYRPPISDVDLVAIGRARLRGWNLANLDSYWSEWLQRARAEVATEARVRLEYGLQWLVPGVPRLHHTIATLEVTSKTGAGRYALEVVPMQWHVVVRAAMALRADRQAQLPAPPDVLWRDALDVSAWLIEDAHRLIEAPR